MGTLQQMHLYHFTTVSFIIMVLVCAELLTTITGLPIADKENGRQYATPTMVHSLVQGLHQQKPTLPLEMSIVLHR